MPTRRLSHRLLAAAFAALTVTALPSCGGGSDGGGGSNTPTATFTPDTPTPGNATIAMLAGSSNGAAVNVRITVTGIDDFFGAAFRVTYDTNALFFNGMDDSASLLRQGGVSNSDLFFDPRILDRLLEESGNVLAYDSTSSRGREQTKVAIKGRQVIDIGKDVPVMSAGGESLGLLRFEGDGVTAMMRVADQLVRGGNENAWVIEATRAVCKQVPLYGVNIAGEAWAEIDFPYDLDVARREAQDHGRDIAQGLRQHRRIGEIRGPGG